MKKHVPAIKNKTNRKINNIEKMLKAFIANSQTKLNKLEAEINRLQHQYDKLIYPVYRFSEVRKYKLNLPDSVEELEKLGVIEIDSYLAKRLKTKPAFEYYLTDLGKAYYRKALHYVWEQIKNLCLETMLDDVLVYDVIRAFSEATDNQTFNEAAEHTLLDFLELLLSEIFPKEPFIEKMLGYIKTTDMEL